MEVIIVWLSETDDGVEFGNDVRILFAADTAFDTGAWIDCTVFITGWFIWVDWIGSDAAVDVVVSVTAKAENWFITGPFSCDVLCLATAANAIGAIGAVVIGWNDVVSDDDTVVAETFSGGAGANDIDSVVVLLGVEHTIDCFRDDELLDDVTDVFRSVFVARTGVGLTGYKKK